MKMGRKRKKVKDLPQRVYEKFGAYYFVSNKAIPDPRKPSGPAKKWTQLCRIDEGKSKMYAELARILGEDCLQKESMPYCVDEFKRKILPTQEYSKQTLKEYSSMLDKISVAFQNFHASEPTTKDCADYLTDKYEGKANTERKVALLMERLFGYIVTRLGLRQDNPMAQFEPLANPKGRKVLLTRDQLMAIRAAGMHANARKDTGHIAGTLSGRTFACMIDMTYLAWQRGIEIRTMLDPKDADTISIKPSKTTKTSGKAVEIKITPAIRAVITQAQKIKRENNVISAFLFPALSGKHAGHPYTKSGLGSMWKRAKARAGLAGVDVQYKDIRAMGATEARRMGVEKEEIRKRLAHTSIKTTEIYFKEELPEFSDLDLPLPWAVAECGT